MIKLRVWVAKNTAVKGASCYPQFPQLSIEAAELGQQKLLLHKVVPIDPSQCAKVLPRLLVQYCDLLGVDRRQREQVIANTLSGYHALQERDDLIHRLSTWLEACCELVKSPTGWLLRRCYVGGRHRLISDNNPYPLGAVADSVDEAWNLLVQRYRSLIAWLSPASIEALDLQSHVLSLDGYSAGTFVHEAIGHPAEFDTHLGSYVPPEALSMNIRDVPFASCGMDYSVSDEGQQGRAVSLAPASPQSRLSEFTGNAFLCWHEDHVQMVIRQRNLQIEAADPQASSAVLVKPSAFITWGGIGSKSGVLALKALVNIGGELKSVAFRFPPGSLVSVLPNGLSRREFASICIKEGSAQIIGLSAVGVNVIFASSLSSYQHQERR